MQIKVRNVPLQIGETCSDWGWWILDLSIINVVWSSQTGTGSSLVYLHILSLSPLELWLCEDSPGLYSCHPVSQHPMALIDCPPQTCRCSWCCFSAYTPCWSFPPSTPAIRSIAVHKCTSLELVSLTCLFVSVSFHLPSAWRSGSSHPFRPGILFLSPSASIFLRRFIASWKETSALINTQKSAGSSKISWKTCIMEKLSVGFKNVGTETNLCFHFFLHELGEEPS